MVRAAVEGERGVIDTEDLHQLEDAFNSALTQASDENKILAADLANVLGALVRLRGCSGNMGKQICARREGIWTEHFCGRLV